MWPNRVRSLTRDARNTPAASLAGLGAAREVSCSWSRAGWLYVRCCGKRVPSGGPATGTLELCHVLLAVESLCAVARQLWDAGRWTCLLSFCFCFAVYLAILPCQACFYYAFDAVP